MTARTVIIHGSDEVLAMVGTIGTYYNGKWKDVKITKVSEDKDTPREVREALVGLVVPTIFSKSRIEKETGTNWPIPEGSRLAYVPDVVNALKSAGKDREANQLERTASSPLDMYVIEGGIYDMDHP